jgi:transcriptional regulator with XRE-family HTH domain
MNEKERINRIMKEKNMNASQFSEFIGIQRAAISHILAGRNNPSLDVIKKILKKFSTINPDWLLYGEGPMERNAQTAASTQVPGKYDLFSQPGIRQPSIPETRPAENKATTDGNTNTTIPVQNSRYPADIPAKIHSTDEQTQGEDVDRTENPAKEIIKETIQYTERPIKTIEKLLIFYSDKTYETFIPEK